MTFARGYQRLVEGPHSFVFVCGYFDSEVINGHAPFLLQLAGAEWGKSWDTSQEQTSSIIEVYSFTTLRKLQPLDW